MKLFDRKKNLNKSNYQLTTGMCNRIQLFANSNSKNKKISLPFLLASE